MTLPRFGLRAKLMVVALSLLAIPWVGYRYVMEMQQYLRGAEEKALQEHARIVAAALGERSTVFDQAADPIDGAEHLFVRPLQGLLQLDGYPDDWALHRDRRRNLHQERLGSSAPNPQDFAVSVSLGSQEADLYVLVEVADDRIVYRAPGNPRTARADRLELWLYDAAGQLVRLTLSTSAPGRLDVVASNARGERLSDTAWASAIRGEWQEIAGGYAVEFKVPIVRLGTRMGLVVYDVDDSQKRGDEARASIGRGASEQNLGTVVVAAPEVERMLLRLVRPGMRAWVIDRNKRVLALAGGLTEGESNDSNGERAQSETYSGWQLAYRLLLRLALDQPTSEFEDDLSTVSRLDGHEVTAALSGTSAARWRQTPDRRVTILTATYPILVSGEVVGAAAIEQTSNSILVVRNRAMEMLINLSAAAFILAVIGGLVLATRLSVRVRRLNREMQQAIGPEGRLALQLHGESANDEIGDLRRGFVDLLDRLAQYHSYLEGLARKLSHELRTPMTVVRSSLDNLAAGAVSEEGKVYLQRAEDGVRRLDAIVSRMSEASRLEQALRSETPQVYDAAAVLRACVEAYRAVYHELAFELAISKEPVWVNGHPDLLAQMLDKLVANARDFRSMGTAIELELNTDDQHAVLQVANEGPYLPEDMGRQIFDSMVSLRDKRGDEPHLGLGLFIVRLVAEFHGGSVKAENRSDKPGVRILVELPVAKSGPPQAPEPSAQTVD